MAKRVSPTAMQKGRLCDVGEKAVLDAIRRAVGSRRTDAFVPGDDAALLRVVSSRLVVSADMLVEDKDFRLSWASFEDVGAKAAMANLSDMAAMGAKPRGLLLSIALRKTSSAADLVRLVKQAHRTGRALGAPVIGGDLSEIDGPMVVSVTVLGEAKRDAWLRHRGREGDVVCVTGTLGNAAAGLSVLERAHDYRTLLPRTRETLVRAQLRPRAPIALAPALAASSLVASAADLSDGLWADGLHVVKKGLGLVIDTTRLPMAKELYEAARHVDSNERRACARAIRWALTGGEDFGLLLALPPRHVGQAQALCRRYGETLTAIGRITARPGLQVWPARKIFKGVSGFAHFQATGND